MQNKTIDRSIARKRLAAFALFIALSACVFKISIWRGDFQRAFNASLQEALEPSQPLLSPHLSFGVSKRLTHAWVAQFLRSNLRGANRYSADNLAHHLLATCQRHSMDPMLILAVIQTESRFEITAKSDKGAHGLMQIQVATANHLSRRLTGGLRIRENDLVDPFVNIFLGVSYLAELKDQYQGVLSDMLAAYNMGPYQWNRIRKQGQWSRFAQQVRKNFLFLANLGGKNGV